MTPAFDVVVVPDFTGPVARRFEIMTLLFLASWLEFAGRSRALPLHIACIGEAPESVRVLADRCGAEITTHAPLLFGAFANKLRGFEVNQKTDHVLLLDVDMLIFSEIGDLSARVGHDCIAAAATNGPCPVARDRWVEIHDALDLAYPEGQVIPLNHELDTFQCAPYRDRQDFPPYYNGGVVYAPWASGLGDVWLDHMNRMIQSSPDIKLSRNNVSNQPSLATAFRQLELQGFGIRLLPDEYNVRWQHIAAGTVTSHETRLLHTIGFGQWRDERNEDLSVGEHVDVYLAKVLQLTRSLRDHRGPVAKLSHVLTRRPRIRDCHRVHALMRLLYDKHVRELKQ